MPTRYLDPYRLKRKALYINPVIEHENLLLKTLPDHDILQNSSADNYVVTPHRKRRPGFHNSPAQNPPFVPSYLEDLRQPHKNFLTQSMSAPPAYLGAGRLQLTASLNLQSIFDDLMIAIMFVMITVKNHSSLKVDYERKIWEIDLEIYKLIIQLV